MDGGLNSRNGLCIGLCKRVIWVLTRSRQMVFGIGVWGLGLKTSLRGTQWKKGEKEIKQTKGKERKIK